MEGLLKAIKLQALSVPDGGAIIMTLDDSTYNKEKNAKLTPCILAPIVKKLSESLDVPVIVLPSGIKMESITQDQLRVLGII